MTMNVEEYQKSLLKCGIAAEVPSPEHMKALCEAVLDEGSGADPVARCVISNGWFATKERRIDRHLLVVPPDEDAIRSVVSAIMPLPARCDTAAIAAIAVLQTLRPSGDEPKIRVPRKRTAIDALGGKKGDIAAAYSSHILSQCKADPSGRMPAPKVPTATVDGRRWVVLAGQQEKPGSDAYVWSAAEVVPADEWEPNPDDWHYYYGRPITIEKSKKAFVGKRATFTPSRT